MYVGVDIEQFVTDPYGSGIQRVLQFLAKEWPIDIAQADFVVPRGDRFGLLTPPQAADLLAIPFQAHEPGTDLRPLFESHLAALNPTTVQAGDLISIYDSWLLPEVTYLPRVLSRLELFAKCMPTAMIGYDVLPMSDPENYRFSPGSAATVSEYFRQLAIADGVVCISGYARDAILGRLRRDPARTIRVAHPGGDHLPSRHHDPSGAASRLRFVRLGTLEARKHPVEILDAFLDATATQGLDADLMFIGRESASDAGINRAISAAAAMNPSVTWIRGASDEQVHDLVNGSSAFVSIGNEGYGIPVLEAIRLGCPVLFDGVQPAGDLMEGRGARRVAGMSHADLVQLFATYGSERAIADLRATIDSDAVPTWSDFARSVVQTVSAG